MPYANKRLVLLIARDLAELLQFVQKNKKNNSLFVWVNKGDFTKGKDV